MPLRALVNHCGPQYSGATLYKTLLWPVKRRVELDFGKHDSCPPQKPATAHATRCSSQYSWCRPPRMSFALISQSRGNLCPCTFDRGRGLSRAVSGIPGVPQEVHTHIKRCNFRERRWRTLSPSSRNSKVLSLSAQRRTAQLLRSLLSILLITAREGIQFLWLAV